MSPPVIAITMGDPAGVGPELCLKALASPEVLDACTPLVFGNAGLLARVADHIGMTLEAEIVAAEDWPAAVKAPTIVSCGAMDATKIRPGELQEECGRAAYAYIQDAVRAAMAGAVAGMVTAPINKEALHLAGIPYPGHTEILAHMTGADMVRMMLASEELIVVLTTIHMALAGVPRHLTRGGILGTIKLTDEALQRIGGKRRIVVCGLNPHAGEQGLFGDEELKIIEPAIAEARDAGYDIEGPLPPDTAFIGKRRQETGAYVVMYHDQGLIPFKMLSFDKGVNITLGLPIVRTSVDHGTAFDIAWQGQATPTSLIEAIKWAVRLGREGGN